MSRRLLLWLILTNTCSVYIVLIVNEYCMQPWGRIAHTTLNVHALYLVKVFKKRSLVVAHKKGQSIFYCNAVISSSVSVICAVL